MHIDDTVTQTSRTLIDSLADTHVSFKLDEIRRRCSQLMSDPDALELALDEPVGQPDGTNPYDLG
jgi:hypothetical protein